jgi:signal transduction histidine kinase
VALAREEGTVALRVEDHGRGLPRTAGGDDTPPPAGVGLAGMRERLRPLGGHLAIASSDRGTTLTAVVPLSEAMGG